MSLPAAAGCQVPMRSIAPMKPSVVAKNGDCTASTLIVVRLAKCTRSDEYKNQRTHKGAGDDHEGRGEAASTSFSAAW